MKKRKGNQTFGRLQRLEDRNLLSGAPPNPINHLRTVVEDSGEIRIPVITLDILNGDDAANPLEIVSVTSVGDAEGSVRFDEFVVYYTPAPNFSGTDTFSYTVTDSFLDPNIAGLSGSANIVLTVTPTPDAPEARNDSYSTVGVTPIVRNVQDNDIDVDGDTLRSTRVSGPTNGTLVLNTNGSFTYTPNAGFGGTDSFTYSLSDGTGTANDTATVSLFVNGSPVARNDAFSVNEGGVLSGNVLSNNGSGLDSDPNGDGLTVSSTPVASPTKGALVLNSNGTFTYTPNAGFSGSDSFQYAVSDGASSSTGTVSITVNRANDNPIARDDTLATDEDTTLSGNVLADNGNGADSDSDGGSLSVSVLTTTSSGVLNLNPNGSFSYTPNQDFFGLDSFDYSLSDGQGGGDVGTATITVRPVNDPPVAKNDQFSGNANTTLAGNVLSNNGSGADSDVDSASLTVNTTPVTGPTRGSLVLNSNGSFTYTPNAGFDGTDSFQYRVTDGALSDTATVTLNIAPPPNVPPVAKDDVFRVDEDSTASGNVLGDNGSGADTDANGDGLMVSLLTGPSTGQLMLNTNGSFTLEPADDFNGVINFTYRVSDGRGGSDTGGVAITVLPVNDPPVAIDDEYSGEFETGISDNVITGSGAGSDFDVDGDDLTISTTPAVQPNNGTVTLSSNGAFTYTPNIGFSGSDSFEYTLSDGTAVDRGVVTLSVQGPGNMVPTARDDRFTVAEGSGASGNVLSDNGSGIDSDPDGDPLTVSVAGAPNVGTLELASSGAFSLTLPEDFNGDVGFSYRISDGKGGTDIGAVVISVTPVNDPPQAVDDTFTAAFESEVTGNVITGNGSTSDFDVDGDGLTISTTPAVAPENGSLVLSSNGDFTYTPNVGFSGMDAFEYVLTDGQLSDRGRVSLTIQPSGNVPPVAQDDLFAVDQSADLQGDVLADNGNGVDSDADGDTLLVAVKSGPTVGILTLQDDGRFSWDLPSNFTGDASFEYEVSDGRGGIDVGLATVTVNPVGPAVAKDDFFRLAQDTTLEADLTEDNGNGADVDPANGGLVIRPTRVRPRNGVLSLGMDGQFTYTPRAGFEGIETFSYLVQDVLGTVSIAVVTIEVFVPPETLVEVTSVERNGGRQLLDRFDSLAIQFTESVAASLKVDDLTIRNSLGEIVDISSASVDWDASSTTAIWNLASVNFPVDEYTISLPEASIVGDAGSGFDGDRNGETGGDFVTAAVVTFGGDADQNFVVDFSDFLTLSRNFNATDAAWGDGDFDGNRTVDFADFLELSRNFGKERLLPSAGPDGDEGTSDATVQTSPSSPVSEAESESEQVAEGDVALETDDGQHAAVESEIPTELESDLEIEAGTEQEAETATEPESQPTTEGGSVASLLVALFSSNSTNHTDDAFADESDWIQ